MEETATLDAGLETTDSIVADAIETPVEPEVAETAPAEPTTTAPYQPVIQDERGKSVLDAKAKEHLEQLRATNPELAKAFRDALYDSDRIRRALPNGLKEVYELRKTMEQYGGAEGIQTLQQERQEWTDFDTKYMAGDPQALEFMLQTPESQQAFLKLAPTAFNKFEELNPEGYASYLCQRIVGDAVANDIPVALKLAQHFLAAGDAAKSAEQFDRVVAWFQALDATAKKPVSAPKPAVTAADDPKYKELEQKVTENERTNWKKESGEAQTQIYRAEITRLLAGRKPTEQQLEDIFLRVQNKLGERINEHTKTLDRYFAVKDKAGFMKFADSFSRKNIPELLAEAVARYMPGKPGPKPAAQQAQNGAIRPPLNGAAQPGVTYVPQAPSRDQIDWDSPFTKIREGRAMTVDGKKVTWRR